MHDSRSSSSSSTQLHHVIEMENAGDTADGDTDRVNAPCCSHEDKKGRDDVLPAMGPFVGSQGTDP